MTMDRRSFIGAGFYAALLSDAKAAGTRSVIRRAIAK